MKCCQEKSNLLFRYLCARFYSTKPHGTTSIICPTWAWLLQIDFEKTEVIFGQQAFESRVDFVVVEGVDIVYAAFTLINISLELYNQKKREKHLMKLIHKFHKHWQTGISKAGSMTSNIIIFSVKGKLCTVSIPVLHHF